MGILSASGRAASPVLSKNVPAVVDTPDLELFNRDDFARAWSDAAIVVRRNSPHDFQDRQIYLWIDDEPLGKIRYGEAINRAIDPGRHTVKVFNTLFTRTLDVDVAPGEQVTVQCGTGMPTVGWLLFMFLHVTYLRVWVTRE